MNRLIKSAAVAVAALIGSEQAIAQVPPAEAEALRAEQAEVFAEMFEAPDNVDLMFRYALLSIKLQDFEAAITTLERILIYRPDEPRVKTELGASYFRIGSYPIARFYFDEVANDPAASEDLKVRVAQFVEEIDRRTQTSYFTGQVGLAGVFTTNANNAPGTTDFIVNDTLAQALDPNATDQSDVGAQFSGQVSHFYDLGNATGDQWRSDLSFVSLHFADVSEGDIDAVVVRTGPKLSLDDDRFGVKMRPFVEADHIRYGNDPLLSTIGIGVEITNTIDQNTAFFSDLRIGYRDHHAPAPALGLFPASQDGVIVRGRVGVNYFYDDSLALTGQIVGDYEGITGDAQVNDQGALANDAKDSFEIGLKGTARYFYDSGMEFASRRWMLTGEAGVNYRTFSAPSLGNTTDREDVEFRVGLSNTAYVQDGFALVTRASYFLRESGAQYPQFDLDNLTVSIGAQFQF